jgi:hypothetical protein
MDEDLDLAEAAAYILGERPGLDEDQVWAVLTELGHPPAATSNDLALHLIATECPEITRRTAQTILGEWRAYAALAIEADWDEDRD